MGFFTGVLHIPAVFAFLAICRRSSSADWVLSSGLFTPRGVLGVFCNMIVAIRHGSWSVRVLDETGLGAQKGEGYEYHLLLLAASAFLVIRGAGAASSIACCRPQRTADQYSRPVRRLPDWGNMRKKSDRITAPRPLAGDCQELSCAEPPRGGRVSPTRGCASRISPRSKPCCTRARLPYPRSRQGAPGEWLHDRGHRSPRETQAGCSHVESK